MSTPFSSHPSWISRDCQQRRFPSTHNQETQDQHRHDRRDRGVWHCTNSGISCPVLCYCFCFGTRGARMARRAAPRSAFGTMRNHFSWAGDGYWHTSGLMGTRQGTDGAGHGAPGRFAPCSESRTCCTVQRLHAHSSKWHTHRSDHGDGPSHVAWRLRLSSDQIEDTVEHAVEHAALPMWRFQSLVAHALCLMHHHHHYHHQ